MMDRVDGKVQSTRNVWTVAITISQDVASCDRLMQSTHAAEQPPPPPHCIAAHIKQGEFKAVRCCATL